MRYLAAALMVGLLACPGTLRAEEGPAAGEEKAKTEEEILKGKILEILAKVKGSYADELPSEEWDRIRDGAEKELLELGPEAIPHLLPYMDPAKLKEDVLGKTDTEFATRIKTVVKKLGWISPQMKAALELLMKKLRDKQIVPQEDSPRFMELGSYAAAALEKELEVQKNQSVREKICEILGSMGSAGILEVVEALLWAANDPEPPVRVQALRALALTARDDRNFKPLDRILKEKKAYPLLVNHLAKDPDRRVRLRAATVLGWMEAPGAAEALYNVMNLDKEPSVTSEAAWALQMISGVDADSDEKWDVTMGKLRAWWRKKKASLPPQIKPAEPAIRSKKKDDPEDK